MARFLKKGPTNSTEGLKRWKKPTTSAEGLKRWKKPSRTSNSLGIVGKIEELLETLKNSLKNKL